MLSQTGDQFSTTQAPPPSIYVFELVIEVDF